jgi:hypothetical protein
MEMEDDAPAVTKPKAKLLSKAPAAVKKTDGPAGPRAKTNAGSKTTTVGKAKTAARKRKDDTDDDEDLDPMPHPTRATSPKALRRAKPIRYTQFLDEEDEEEEQSMEGDDGSEFEFDG